MLVFVNLLNYKNIDVHFMQVNKVTYSCMKHHYIYCVNLSLDSLFSILLFNHQILLFCLYPGEISYNCGVCGIAFQHAADMRQHRATVHNCKYLKKSFLLFSRRRFSQSSKHMSSSCLI